MNKKTLLITGGAGFIGSHVVRRFVNEYPDYLIVNLDKLTYAGNLENLKDVENSPNYLFVKGDITDAAFMETLFNQYQFDGVIHLAAESHVDRSISNPMEFVMTNVVGTVNLLNMCKMIWNGQYENKLFYHVSTDEVYGELGDDGKFLETTESYLFFFQPETKSNFSFVIRLYNSGISSGLSCKSASIVIITSP
jgi:dTDP-glucose 4,6-dehydratase